MSTEPELCARCHHDPIANMNTGLCSVCIAVDYAKESIVAVTKDSGTRREFPTGSVRDGATGKGRFDLMSPMVARRDAGLLERGAVKYGERNWEKGQPMSVALNCAKRHLEKHHMGYRDEDHLAAARWNIACMMHVEHQIARGMLPAELDDLPCYVTDEERDSGGGW
jgi:hypothetical protein